MKAAATIVFLFFLAYAIPVKSQVVDTVLRHRFFIAWSLDHTDTRDEQASPLLYFGNGNPLGFGYEYRGNSYRHLFQTSFSISGINANELKPDLQDDPNGRKTFFGNAFVTYSYLRDFQEPALTNLRFSLGGAFDNTVFARLYKYFSGDPYSSGGELTWESLNSLSPEIRIDYDLSSQSKFYSELLLPAISLVGRPGYNFSNTNSQFFSGNNFHVVLIGGLIGWNYSLTFEQAMWNALLFSASYNSRYYRYERYGWTTSVLIQNFVLQISWRFGA